eukprot:CAMPEP_0174330658 /NCGR_PEP_ID=MMETSP0810-20121108/16850_1 /TAXON_ID=73025 ORGANISM="Eutreptiella gymnastica-like, Strain CCMP1594" /NCGR_SAMPLE_ID=MMETSP0810 /ASSEMBLY_ACC=CAM_ASM_000659 /LENGTH=51 /DNA_ID=CAMNT_0015445951 /DNA_START=419 /DNA_END=571 /DNA_ORIENTATION=+
MQIRIRLCQPAYHPYGAQAHCMPTSPGMGTWVKVRRRGGTKGCEPKEGARE